MKRVLVLVWNASCVYVHGHVPGSETHVGFFSNQPIVLNQRRLKRTKRTKRSVYYVPNVTKDLGDSN